MYLIANGSLLSFFDSARYTPNGAVAVDGARIVAVGADEELRSRYPDAELIDARGGLIMPGLIDLHTHSRNCFLSLDAVLAGERDRAGIIFDRLQKQLDRKIDLELSRLGAYAHAMRCIKRGVTTFFDLHSSFAVSGSLATVAAVDRELGLRVCLGTAVSNRFGAKKFDEELAENLEFGDYCSALGGDMLRAVFGVHSASELDEDALRSIAHSCGSRLPLHIHAAQSAEDSLSCFRRFNTDPIALLDRNGLLGDGTMLIGCSYTSARELELIRERGAAVVATPLSSTLLCHGGITLGELESSGVRFAAGTDAVDAAPLGLCLTSALVDRSGSVPFGGLLELARRAQFKTNAEIASDLFGVPLGRLEEGAAADIIILENESFENDTPDAGLLMKLGTARCRFTMVAGRILMMDGRLAFPDEKRINSLVADASRRLWS